MVEDQARDPGPATQPAALAALLRRYLDGATEPEALRAAVAAIDRARTPDPRLARAAATALLVIMEQEEGVRPPADVRTTLLALERTLLREDQPTPHGDRAPRRPPPTPPKPPPAKHASPRRATAAVPKHSKGGPHGARPPGGPPTGKRRHAG